MNRFRTWIIEVAERTALADGAVIAAGFFAFYLLTIMPGPGWGSGADLQRSVLGRTPGDASILFTAPAYLFTRIVGSVPAHSSFGNPAFRVNLFVVILSVASLLVVYATARLFVVNRVAAAAGAVALGFAHVYHLHAVTPNVIALFTFGETLTLYALVRFCLTGSRVSLGCAALLIGLSATVVPALAACVVLPLVVSLTGRWSPRPILTALLLVAMTVAGLAVAGDFGLLAPLLLVGFLIIEFPFTGWFLFASGVGELARRARGVLDLLLACMLVALPLRAGGPLEDLFGAMLPALPPAALILAAGVDRLLARPGLRREKFMDRHTAGDAAAAVILGSLALFALLSAGSLAYTLRMSGLETRLAIDARPWIDLHGNSWHDAAYYALWAAKNGQGSYEMIQEAERYLPPDAVLFVDPAIEPAIRYAQEVEERMPGLRTLMLDTPLQVAAIRTEAAAGRRIFLAGTDPEFYDVPGMVEKGELISAGRFYEWRLMP